MWLATGGEEVGMLSFCGTRERAWGRFFRGGVLRSAATESRRATVSGQLPLLMFLQAMIGDFQSQFIYLIFLQAMIGTLQRTLLKSQAYHCVDA